MGHTRGKGLAFLRKMPLDCSAFAFSPFATFLGGFYFPYVESLTAPGNFPVLTVSSLFRESLGLPKAKVFGVLFMVGFLEIFNNSDFI